MQQDALNALDNQLKALELRKAGVSYQRIAETLGYKDASGAWRAVKSALKKTLQEPAAELRTLEIERLDAMLSAIWASVKQGQYGAIDRAIKIMERKAKLLGMDAPVKIAPVDPDGNKYELLVKYADPNDKPTPPTPQAD